MIFKRIAGFLIIVMALFLVLGSTTLVRSDDKINPDQGLEPTLTHDLIIHIVGPGSVFSNVEAGIACAPNCNATLDHGTVVTLTVIPDMWALFMGWSGSASGTDNPLVITLDETKELTATFKASHSLAVAKNGTGSGTVTGAGIDCGSDCGELVADGTTVVLTATASAGSIFSGWWGNLAGFGITSNPVTFTMSDDAYVFAQFNIPFPYVQISKDGAHNVSLSWANPGDYSTFDVWRSAAPYFTPVAPAYATVTDAPWSKIINGDLGYPAANHFYMVSGVKTAGGTDFSRRLGEFDFALTPGTP